MSPVLAAVHPVALELLARAKSGEGVKSGPIGLAVILVLCIASYFLFKSMSKHMRRVREEFPQDEQGEPAATTSADMGTTDVTEPASASAEPASAHRGEPADVPPAAPPRQDPA